MKKYNYFWNFFAFIVVNILNLYLLTGYGYFPNPFKDNFQDTILRIEFHKEENGKDNFSNKSFELNVDEIFIKELKFLIENAKPANYYGYGYLGYIVIFCKNERTVMINITTHENVILLNGLPIRIQISNEVFFEKINQRIIQ